MAQRITRGKLGGGHEALVVGIPTARGRPSQLAIDIVAAGLFIVFVGFLFLGSQDPGFPYDPVAAVPLAGSLGALFWANLRADRFDRTVPAA